MADVLAWCSYDFANSSFATVVLTVAFSPFFVQVVAPDPISGNVWLGRLVSLAMLSVALLAPLLGAVADASGSKRRFLIGFALLCIAATALLGTISKGQVVWAALTFIIATIGFAGANVFYNAFLPEIASPSLVGRISGMGFAAGYLGGMGALILSTPFLRGAPSEGWARAFPVTAAFFLLFALPSFLLLRDRPRPEPEPGAAARALSQTLQMIRWLPRTPELLKFMAAYFLYNDAIHTVIVFSGAYATQTLGFEGGEIARLFIALQVAALLGAIALGHVSDRIGPKRTIVITLLGWIAVSISAYACTTKAGFVLVGIGAGLFIGSNQAASRALFVRLIPASRAAQLFGLQALCGKFSDILGPILWGEVVRRTGSQRPAVLAVGALFALGLSVIFVDEEKGQRELHDVVKHHVMTQTG